LPPIRRPRWSYCRSRPSSSFVELDDNIATRVTVVFYSDTRDALLKALIE